jgi:L-lactate dehydrogenase complex protein LldG
MPERLPPSDMPPPADAAARERILGRLRAASATAAAAGHPPPSADAADTSFLAAKVWPPAERLARLRRCMEAVKAEFVEATAATWPAAARDLLRAAGAHTLWAGGGSPLAPPLAAAWAASEASKASKASEDTGGAPQLVLYDRPIEELKTSLFTTAGAGITTCLGGIAETGGLILCPSPREPRLLSLVPPIHLVLLDPARIWDTFWHAVRDLGWSRSIPPNALVISGPSKTADIEQTLAYGVHGPKRLVVLLVPGAPV